MATREPAWVKWLDPAYRAAVLGDADDSGAGTSTREGEECGQPAAATSAPETSPGGATPEPDDIETGDAASLHGQPRAGGPGDGSPASPCKRTAAALLHRLVSLKLLQQAGWSVRQVAFDDAERWTVRRPVRGELARRVDLAGLLTLADAVTRGDPKADAVWRSLD